MAIDAGVGVEMLDHHRHAGRGDDVQIDHFDAAGGQRRDGGIAHPVAAGPGVAAEDDAEMLAVGGLAVSFSHAANAAAIRPTTAGVSVPPMVPRMPETPIINASMLSPSERSRTPGAGVYPRYR